MKNIGINLPFFSDFSAWAEVDGGSLEGHQGQWVEMKNASYIVGAN